MKYPFLLALLLVLPLQALSKESPQKSERDTVSFSVKFEGKEYVIFIRKKGVADPYVVEQGGGLKRPDPEDIDKLKVLGKKLATAAALPFGDTVVVLEKGK